jgi:hypothetical protein
VDADTCRKLPIRVGNNLGEGESFVSANAEPIAAANKHIENTVLNRRKTKTPSDKQCGLYSIFETASALMFPKRFGQHGFSLMPAS